MMREQAHPRGPLSTCSGYAWSFDVLGQLQSSLRFLTWSRDGRWRAAALDPCTWCADLQGQTSSWDLNINSNQRSCLLFGTVRMWLALESLWNNLCLYHTPHSLEGDVIISLFSGPLGSGFPVWRKYVHVSIFADVWSYLLLCAFHTTL